MQWNQRRLLNWPSDCKPAVRGKKSKQKWNRKQAHRSGESAGLVSSSWDGASSGKKFVKSSQLLVVLIVKSQWRSPGVNFQIIIHDFSAFCATFSIICKQNCQIVVQSNSSRVSQLPWPWSAVCCQSMTFPRAWTLFTASISVDFMLNDKTCSSNLAGEFIDNDSEHSRSMTKVKTKKSS